MNLHYFLKLMENSIFFCQSNEEFHLTLANLEDIFKALNVLKFDFADKNIDRINDCDAINAFVAKLELGIIEFKEMQLPFLI